MAWWKAESKARHNTKFRRAGPEASWLWFLCNLYSAEQETDGYVPADELPFIWPWDKPEKLAAKLVEVGLFEKSGTGYTIHDYLDYNPSKDEANRIRQQRALAGKASAFMRQRAESAARQDQGRGPEKPNKPSTSRSPEVGTTTSQQGVGNPSTSRQQDASVVDVVPPEQHGNQETGQRFVEQVVNTPSDRIGSVCSGIGGAGGKGADSTTEKPWSTRLGRFYDEEYRELVHRPPTVSEDIVVDVGRWVEEKRFSDDELRYMVRRLVEDEKPLSFLKARADPYLAQRSHDDFETAPTLTAADIPGADPGTPPPEWKPPPGWEKGPDGHARRLAVGSPLPEGYAWGVDGQAHDTRRLAPPPKPAPKEKYVLVRDDEKIARMKAQLAAMAKQDAGAKAADASTSPEAKS